MIEEWKDIEGYEGLYQVSNLGRVRSLGNGVSKNSKERILKLHKTQYCYLQVLLYKQRKRKYFSVHRLVAEAFIPNPDNKPFIDHINTIKDDNRINNLKWVTHKENMNNPLTIEKIKNNSGKQLKGRISKLHNRSKPILQLDNNMELIRKWDCAMDVKRELGFNNGDISKCCNGKLKESNGYIWGFEKDYEQIPFKVFDLKIYKKVS